MPPWVRLIVLPVFVVGAVKLGGDASQLHVKGDEGCPAVIDVNRGRGVDYECSSDGGQSKDSAVLVLAILSLSFGGGAVLLAVSVLGDVSRSRDPARQTDGLAADLAELDARHERGLFTDEERQRAIERRLRRN